MSGPPPPPKRKNHKPVATYGTGSGIPVPVSSKVQSHQAEYSSLDFSSSAPTAYVPVGSGHNVARAISENNQNSVKVPTKPPGKPDANSHNRKPKNRICVLEDHPDAVIGAGVEIHGDFQFDKLLRIDGKFQGNLFSNNRGDIVIGKNGCIIGEVIVARKMIVEGGHVIGKIVAEELLLQDHTIIKGDITCKLLQIEGPNVTIHGRANVHALAPELVDEYDNIITEVPKKAKKVKKEIYAPRSPGKQSMQSHSHEDEEEEGNEPAPPPVKDAATAPPPSLGAVGKSRSAQTNASAKPARSSPVRDPEEAAALEAAMAERNAAKERHRLAKQAKKGGSEDPTSPPPELAPVKPPANQSAAAQKAAASVVNSAIDEVIASPRVAQSQSVKAATMPAPSAKSPAKLLPPSEAQRKEQMEKDKNASAPVPEVVPDSPDVEREKAAINVQRVARGRIARRGTQNNEVAEARKSAAAAAEAAAAKTVDSPGGDVLDAELQKQQEAATNLQKVTRGRIARQEIAKQEKAAVNVQKIARGKLARNHLKAGESGKGGVVEGDGEGGGEGDGDGAEAAASVAGAQPSPFGPGYAEQLVMQS